MVLRAPERRADEVRTERLTVEMMRSERDFPNATGSERTAGSEQAVGSVHAGRHALTLAAALAVLSCGSVESFVTDPAELAANVVVALRQKDWLTLSRLAHPERGVRFTPYAYVDLESDLVLSPEQLAVLDADEAKERGREPHVRRWGVFDGTGEPIEMTVDEYYGRFLYDRDFASAERGGPNERVGHGNSLNDMPAVFGDRDVVFFEYHVPGTERYGGMDWRSLRVVLERIKNRWYLIGLVHDEWTI